MKEQRKETTLLDSSLNTATFPKVPSINLYKNYNIKVIDCKGYKQIYVFSNNKSHKIAGLEIDKKKSLDIDSLIDIKNFKKEPLNGSNDNKMILYRNVMRSKLKLQRIAKANEYEWKTFITLTFKDKITDLTKAYKIFRSFITVVSRYKKNFKWLCVPEFQKNGRVHYHMVTNIELDNDKLIYTQELDNGELAYHLKHWSKGLDENNLPLGKGYDCIETIKDKEGNDSRKLCGYISKYMTKAFIEDCFFNKNRYYLSQNLYIPFENYIDFRNSTDALYYEMIMTNYDMIYTKSYKDTLGNSVTFLEYKIKDNDN